MPCQAKGSEKWACGDCATSEVEYSRFLTFVSHLELSITSVSEKYSVKSVF